MKHRTLLAFVTILALVTLSCALAGGPTGEEDPEAGQPLTESGGEQPSSAESRSDSPTSPTDTPAPIAVLPPAFSSEQTVADRAGTASIHTDRMSVLVKSSLAPDPLGSAQGARVIPEGFYRRYVVEWHKYDKDGNLVWGPCHEEVFHQLTGMVSESVAEIHSQNTFTGNCNGWGTPKERVCLVDVYTGLDQSTDPGGKYIYKGAHARPAERSMEILGQNRPVWSETREWSWKPPEEGYMWYWHETRYFDAATGMLVYSEAVSQQFYGDHPRDHLEGTGVLVETNAILGGGAPSPTCSPGWKCKDDHHRAYLGEDCSWSNVEYCEHGCENGECKAPMCSPGWKCRDESHKAYQNADCSWSSETYCEYGCQNGECKAPTCSPGWRCKDESHLAYQNVECSWSSESYCEHGCQDGKCVVPPTAISLLVENLVTDKERYRADEPITFRFTVKNTGAAQATFKFVIGVRDPDGATTKWTSREDYTIAPQQEIQIQHVVPPMARPWPEGEGRWQMILVGPPPGYSQQYVETDFEGRFFVLPAESGPMGAKATVVDVGPKRLLVDDWLYISFTVENTGEADRTFAVMCTVWGPGGYSTRLPTQTLTVPKGQTSGLTTFRWQAPRDAPAGTYDVEIAVYRTDDLLDRDEAVAAFMIDKNYSYVETRLFTGPFGERVGIHLHHSPGDIPGSLLLVDVLAKLKTMLSIYDAAIGGVLDTVSAAIDVYGQIAPDLLAVKSQDGSVDVLFLQVEDLLNIGYLYNGGSFIDVGGKLLPPTTVTSLLMRDIPAPAHWTLAPIQAMSTEQLQQLVERYAPIVYLHPREVYAPGPVSQMLENAALRGSDGSQVMDRGAVTPDTFDLHNGTGYWLDLAPKLQSLQETGQLKGCEGSPAYEDLYGRIARGDENIVYARVVTGPDWLVIQYWFFYLYNDWCNKHEGDWELIELVFESILAMEEALATDVAPAFVAYSQHLGGERVAWSETIWSAEDQTRHPWVFVARGSHANYPSPGWRFLVLGWDEVEAGTVVKPQVVLVAPAGDGGLLADAKWAKFTGRWGESGMRLSSAPQGLLAKEAWLEPYEWAMTLPRTEPLDDAQSLWVWVGSPVELHLYDAQGRHVGPSTAGEIELEIPGLTYESDPTTGRALAQVRHFDPAQGYRVVLEGTAAGNAHLAIAIPERDDEQQIIEFSDIPVTTQFRAQFVVPVKSRTERRLQIDADGDGTFEQEQEPDKSQTVSLDVRRVERPYPRGLSLLLYGIGVLCVSAAVVGIILTLRRLRPS